MKLLNLRNMPGAQTGKCRKISSMCAIYKASTGERALKAKGDSYMLQST